MGISTHVLDTAIGRPAADVGVKLAHLDANGAWRRIAEGVTDADGRVAPLVTDADLVPGDWRITFATGAYFDARGERSFHPSVTIDFRVDDATQHYHVPLLTSAWSWSTYRGS